MEQNIGIGTRVNHKDYDSGVIIQVKNTSYIITFIDYGNREISKTDENLKIIDVLEQPDDMISMEQVELALINILKRFSDISEITHIADKWKKGTLVFKPYDQSLKSYEMPIDTFFHKIVMVRDRLRVMEQKINSSKNLSDDEKVDLQQYITRIYGSLTSFNILFNNKSDNFVGSGSKK